MYYWQILNLNENELVHKFFIAQSLRPSKNDWALQIQTDMNDIGLVMSKDEIRKITKDKFQSIVQARIKVCVKEYFLKIQSKQSKTSHLKISDCISPAEYLSSNRLSVPEIRTLFRLRSRTVNVKGNQSSSFRNNMSCRTCFSVDETQEHIFHCTAIRSKVNFLKLDSVNYQMIFGKLVEQEDFTKIYHVMLQARTDILKSNASPSPSGGPVHL